MSHLPLPLRIPPFTSKRPSTSLVLLSRAPLLNARPKCITLDTVESMFSFDDDLDWMTTSFARSLRLFLDFVSATSEAASSSKSIGPHGTSVSLRSDLPG
eukprot:CCRYP_017007-RA/>CCRYP_017007-RA protein AED:0.14 eAED:0.16 QI:0/0/0.5/1/0/0/2/861/99